MPQGTACSTNGRSRDRFGMHNIALGVNSSQMQRWIRHEYLFLWRAQRDEGVAAAPQASICRCQLLWRVFRLEHGPCVPPTLRLLQCSCKQQDAECCGTALAAQPLTQPHPASHAGQTTDAGVARQTTCRLRRVPSLTWQIGCTVRHYQLSGACKVKARSRLRYCEMCSRF